MKKESKKSIEESLAAIEQIIFESEQILNNPESTKDQKKDASKTMATAKMCKKRFKKMK